VYALAGALVGFVPLPIVPRRLVRTLRGAVAHDACARHAIALTPDARDVLAEPAAPGKEIGLVREAMTFAAGRALTKVAPFGVMYGPLKDGWETLAFGRLLDRYLGVHRKSHTVRIDLDEAREIRQIVDRAAMRALELGLRADAPPEPSAAEDYRGTIERVVDGALIGLARLPEVVARRLDAALDDVVAAAGRAEGA
jgi:hypothetical protein